jgi:hypothetical protein
MFLAIGALFVELDRERGMGWQRPAQKVQLVAVTWRFIRTLLPTATAIVSLASGRTCCHRRSSPRSSWRRFSPSEDPWLCLQIESAGDG